jgi:hypothetical protein
LNSRSVLEYPESRPRIPLVTPASRWIEARSISMKL